MNKQQTKGYVYLLMSKDQKSFKIGKANNVNDRLEQLEKAWQFDLSKSYVLEVNLNNTLNIERMLHRFLSDFRLENKDKKDGYTEFFKCESMVYLHSHIKSIQQLHNIKIFTFNDFIKENSTEELKNKKVNDLLKINTEFKVFANIFFFCLKKYFETKETDLIIKGTESLNNEFYIKDINLNNLKEFLKKPFKNDISLEFITEFETTTRTIKISINKEYIDILNHNNRLQKINYNDLMKITSNHSKQLYFLLIQTNGYNPSVSTEKEVLFELNEFKRIMGIEDKYIGNSNDLKKRVINICEKQLNDNTNIYIRIKLFKKHNKHFIKINYKNKEVQKTVKIKEVKPMKEIVIPSFSYNIINYTQNIYNVSF